VLKEKSMKNPVTIKNNGRSLGVLSVFTISRNEVLRFYSGFIRGFKAFFTLYQKKLLENVCL
jgi:hypothetical protein